MYTTALQAQMSTDADMFSNELALSGTPELDEHETVKINAFSDNNVSKGAIGNLPDCIWVTVPNTC